MEKRRTVNANASILVKIANSELIMEQPMGLERELHPKIIENRGWVTWFRGKQKKKKKEKTSLVENENIQGEGIPGAV